MVMEYMDYDLAGLLSHSGWTLTPANIKSLMQQMLSGLAYMHKRGILHRDIKGSNLLLNRHGQVKYADFGLARTFHSKRMHEFTNRVITIWYRPPELLLGATLYGGAVDVWSLGCIMVELFMRRPPFQGHNEITQLEQIYRVLGTPNETNWPDYKDLPWSSLLYPKAPQESRFRDIMSRHMDQQALDLAEAMLSMDPKKRPSAEMCLEHPYFTKSDIPPYFQYKGTGTNLNQR
ncbi:kinase subunit of RNA polymerase II carboxy-terminal domain kinase I [Spiromyces aspiralis]|uniref:Kinase subunit of RNA polymerase II carboxy-terminal domain kinase I n=1 Tax=Spiromyces aspiralis TaxID=68401 RepID=A0ACC1HUL5_9FUNG|nr:kinase subunit of RNA polymerase II carboxy-terminal domain kinase I [Spiromyces aspiralis]